MKHHMVSGEEAFSCTSLKRAMRADVRLYLSMAFLSVG